MASGSTPSSIPALVYRLRNGRPAQQWQAAATLADLAAQGLSNQQAIVSSGAVQVLAQLVGRSNAQLRQGAMEALVNIGRSQTGEECGHAFAAAGGLPPLLRRLASCKASEQEQQMAATLAGYTMVGFLDETVISAADANRQALLDSACVPVLVRMLGSREALNAHAAAVTLGRFCAIADPPAFSDAAVAAGAVPALTALLRSSNHDLQAASSQSLLSLVSGTTDSSMAAYLDAAIIPAYVQLLGSSSKKGAAGSCHSPVVNSRQRGGTPCGSSDSRRHPRAGALYRS